MSKLTSGYFLWLDDALDLEKEGIGAKKVMLMKNYGSIVENMEISEDVTDVSSEVSKDAPGDNSTDVSKGKVQSSSSDSSSSIPSGDISLEKVILNISED